MADTPPDSPLQSFFRLTIMVGTAVVGGMAFKVYGPPPEKLGPLLDQAMTYAKQLAAEVSADTSAAASAPPASSPVPAAPAFAAAPPAPTFTHAAGVTPPAGRSASITAAVANDSSLGPLVAQLEAAGAEQLEIDAWGTGGGLVRCTCTRVVPGSAFKRMIDTIEPTPSEALRGMLVQMQSAGAIAQYSSAQAY